MTPREEERGACVRWLMRLSSACRTAHQANLLADIAKSIERGEHLPLNQDAGR